MRKYIARTEIARSALLCCAVLPRQQRWTERSILSDRAGGSVIQRYTMSSNPIRPLLVLSYPCRRYCMDTQDAWCGRYPMQLIIKQSRTDGRISVQPMLHLCVCVHVRHESQYTSYRAIRHKLRFLCTTCDRTANATISYRPRPSHL